MFQDARTTDILLMEELSVHKQIFSFFGHRSVLWLDHKTSIPSVYATYVILKFFLPPGWLRVMLLQSEVYSPVMQNIYNSLHTDKMLNKNTWLGKWKWLITTPWLKLNMTTIKSLQGDITIHVADLFHSLWQNLRTTKCR